LPLHPPNKITTDSPPFRFEDDEPSRGQLLYKGSVGEFRKTHHPRNVEVNEICDASFQGQRTHEDLETETHEVSELRMRSGLDSRTLEASES
jgi:hypothetical protein